MTTTIRTTVLLAILLLVTGGCRCLGGVWREGLVHMPPACEHCDEIACPPVIVE